MKHLDVHTMTMIDKTGFGVSEQNTASYEVGYGKPPKATQFQPGRSGNPRGRPRGRTKRGLEDAFAEPLKALLLEEAYRMIATRDGDRAVEVPVLQLVLRSLMTKAAKGDAPSQRMLLDRVAGIEAEQRRESEKFYEALVTHKFEGARAIAAAKARGLPEPEFLPHPDHLIIHPLQGTVIVLGPLSVEEKERWDEALLLKRQIEQTLAELLDQQAEDPDDDPDLAQRIEAHRRIIGRIDDFLRNFERVILKGAGC
jgi:Family of unknown function (DUF5681)